MSNVQLGDCIRFYDSVDRSEHTGTVIALKDEAGFVAQIHWDDGYHDSWVRANELERIA
jgi:hypothetical protein